MQKGARMHIDRIIARKNTQLNSLFNYPHDAIIGFLRKEMLSTSGTNQVQRNRVRSAVLNDKIPLSQLNNWLRELERINASMGLLNEFNRRFPKINKFRIDKGLPGGVLNVLIEIVKSELYRFRFPLSDWINYLDVFQEYGRQYVFPFRLQPNNEEYLVRLRQTKEIQEILEKIGSLKLYNKSEFCYDAKNPRLVAVVHSTDILKFKWVWMRSWIQNNSPQKDRILFFSQLNLNTGDLELRIQKLKSGQGGYAKLQKEFEVSQKLVSKMLDFSKFSPLLLEPAMRRLQVSDKIVLTNWKIKYASKGELEGRYFPNFPNFINLIFRRFYTKFIRGNWKDNKGQNIPIEMDAMTNHIYLRRECTRGQLDSILSEVRRLIQLKQSLSDRKISPEKRLALERFELSTAQLKLFEYLRTLGLTEIPVNEIKYLARRMWIHFKELKDLFQKLEYKGEKGFKLKYFVRYPDTQKLAKSKDGIKYFDRFENIPHTIPVENGKKGRPEITPQEKDIIFTVKDTPVESGKPVGIKFLFIFIPLSLVTTLALLFMLNYFNKFWQIVIILTTYLSLQTVEMAVAITATGRGNLELAVKYVTLFFKNAIKKVD